MPLLFGLASFGCVAEPADFDDTEDTASRTDGIIIGTNDLVSVAQDGSNVPARYRGLLDGFGRAVYNGALCTATHVGNGIVVSAGHCFGAPASRVNNQSCAGGYVEWGRRGGSNGTRTDCQQILAMQTGGGLDYAIYRVSPVPPVSIGVQLSPPASVGQRATIFSHPGGRPLEWSQTCSVTSTSGTELRYQCDTQGGSSGASVLNDDTLQVMGLHWGGGGDANAATHLSSTPLAELLGSNPSGTVSIPVRHSGKCLDVAGAGTADRTNIQQWDCNGTKAQAFSLRSAGAGVFEIVNSGSGKCVDVDGASTANGANVQLYTCNGTNAQRFRIEGVGGGYSRIVNVNSNRCLDVADWSQSAGGNVIQWDCLGGENQQWRVSACSGITLYQNTSYGGTGVTLPPGDYNLAALTPRGAKNDDASSLRVPSGCSVTLYEHDNFGGASLGRTSDDATLVDDGWNDRMSSIRVR